MNEMRIYIAGPYQARDCTMHGAPLMTQRNVDRAIRAFHRLKREGHEPFVPHLSHYIHIHASCPEDYGEWWYGYDLTFLDHWAEAIYMLNGFSDSKGARLELKRAMENGLEIMFEGGRDD
jgi:hypothetical protein